MGIALPPHIYDTKLTADRKLRIRPFRKQSFSTESAVSGLPPGFD